MRNFYHLSTHSNPRAIYDRKVDSLTLEKVEDSHAIEPQSMADLLRLRKSELKTLHRKNTELMGQPGYDDLYCITIRARSFLHNMVRKIVWVIKECGEGREFTTTNVRIADAYPLVFAGCRFPHALNFLGNRYSLPHFEEAEMRQRIMHQISRLRLLSFYK
ncbi:hypothetical protein PAPHI01_2581 [Pancytospora philotis]|nr:hypothetical protein PAPHI01_2581 [Pancytospora philotis]